MFVPLIVTGDNARLFLTITIDDATFNIDAGDTVEAALVSVDHEELLMAAVPQSFSTTGADWANSLIAIKFTAAQTTDITSTGNVLVAVQVTQGG
ncbi:MAG: hypothetical protein KAT90_14080, partial [Gammaproteobacteria bacterium]|nr:hypothetical protein [Gammaproteobacteria bacterium]